MKTKATRVVFNPLGKTLEGDGRKLNGKYAHYCYEWDDMLIDETCEEFSACVCGKPDPRT